MSKQKPQLGPFIHRVRLERLTIFEVTEAELDEMERGSSEALLLNLCIAAISIAVSFLISLLTTTFDNTKTFCVFVIICVVGFLAGITYGLLWWRTRKRLKNVTREVRARMLPEGIVDAPDNGAQESTSP